MLRSLLLSTLLIASSLACAPHSPKRSKPPVLPKDCEPLSKFPVADCDVVWEDKSKSCVDPSLNNEKAYMCNEGEKPSANTASKNVEIGSITCNPMTGGWEYQGGELSEKKDHEQFETFMASEEIKFSCVKPLSDCTALPLLNAESCSYDYPNTDICQDPTNDDKEYTCDEGKKPVAKSSSKKASLESITCDRTTGEWKYDVEGEGIKTQEEFEAFMGGDSKFSCVGPKKDCAPLTVFDKTPCDAYWNAQAEPHDCKDPTENQVNYFWCDSDRRPSVNSDAKGRTYSYIICDRAKGEWFYHFYEGGDEGDTEEQVRAQLGDGDFKYSCVKEL